VATANAAQAKQKTVSDPCAAYETMKHTWERNRAVCSGQEAVKSFDDMLDLVSFTNLLIPFSTTMSPQQYAFYKAEAELPGITASFSKMVVGGLLRKPPSVKLPEGLPPDATSWITNEFGKDDSPLVAFLDSILWEEIQSGRAWVFVDYPYIPEGTINSKEELLNYKPYPVMYQAESIINWRTKTGKDGRTMLDMVIVRGLEAFNSDSEFHPTFRDTAWVHELNEQGLYQIRKYQKPDPKTVVQVVAGQQAVDTTKQTQFELVSISDQITIQGERLTFIPAWPLNGSIDILQSVLTAIIDKELALYNKVSRRNHLLYGAATYTPYISSNMSDEQFKQIVNGGLGSWFRLDQGDTCGIMETPTNALTDMDRAIAAGIEEMAKLGIRMLTPETDQSGVALEIRNAAQTAQMGSMNSKVSQTMRQVISFMLNWRYGLALRPADIEFSMSTDFNPMTVGEGWLRLATEWYQQGLFPRSAWLELLKHNDMLPPDYDDEVAREEITADLDTTMAMMGSGEEGGESYASSVEKKSSAKKPAKESA